MDPPAQGPQGHQGDEAQHALLPTGWDWPARPRPTPPWARPGEVQHPLPSWKPHRRRHRHPAGGEEQASEEPSPEPEPESASRRSLAHGERHPGLLCRLRLPLPRPRLQGEANLGWNWCSWEV